MSRPDEGRGLTAYVLTFEMPSSGEVLPSSFAPLAHGQVLQFMELVLGGVLPSSELNSAALSRGW